MKEVSARPAVMFSWTAWGSASPRVQICGSPQTWSSAQGGPSPVAPAVPGEERQLGEGAILSSSTITANVTNVLKFLPDKQFRVKKRSLVPTP